MRVLKPQKETKFDKAASKAIGDAMIVLAVLKLSIKRKRYSEMTSEFQDQIIAAHDALLAVAIQGARNQKKKL